MVQPRFAGSKGTETMGDLRALSVTRKEGLVEIFLLVLAALFPVVNPPGAGLIFLSMTRHASSQTRRSLARRVAVNAFFVMAVSLPVGALVLKIYGISIPVLRVAGGLIVAVAGWKLLNEGSPKSAEEISPEGRKSDFTDQAFYPLTLPLTTGPGTIAVMISLGLSRSAYSDNGQDLQFFVATLLATMVIAFTIYFCFAYSDRVQRVLGVAGTDILVRLTAFILFCLGVQIIWTGASELLGTVLLHKSTMTCCALPPS
jgi:multiple antibiotic resistance protein